MARGKFEKKKRIFPVVWILVMLIILGSTAGGVAAYLSTSSQESKTTFTVAQMPTVTADGDIVVINSPDCEKVFLRVAVAANEMYGDNIVADTVSYVTSSTGWTKINDVIYEYGTPLEPGTYSLSELELKLPANATVAAQVIQAVGTIDNGDQSAKANAWNGSPAIP